MVVLHGLEPVAQYYIFNTLQAAKLGPRCELFLCKSAFVAPVLDNTVHNSRLSNSFKIISILSSVYLIVC